MIIQPAFELSSFSQSRKNPVMVEIVSKNALLIDPTVNVIMYIPAELAELLFRRIDMKLNIAENIRKNRHEKNLSQEVLAERLGVSFQTISKWERGECYPDIEMLPEIASFFGITIDVLMGTDTYQEKEDVAKIQEKLRYYDMLRDEKSLINCAENALKKYPNNHLLMAWIVYGSQNINPKRSIELGEYVLENCRNSHILNWVRTELCYAYCKSGNRDKSVETARKLPNSMQTRDSVLADILEGESHVEHLLESVIAKYGYNFKSSILKLMDYYDPRQQIELLKKSSAIFDVIYETEDCVSALKEKTDNYCRMAKICLSVSSNNEAKTYIKEALKCAERHDTISFGEHSSAILCGCEKYNYNVQHSGELAHPYQMLKEKTILSLEADPAFAEIINELT